MINNSRFNHYNYDSNNDGIYIQNTAKQNRAHNVKSGSKEINAHKRAQGMEQCSCILACASSVFSLPPPPPPPPPFSLSCRLPCIVSIND